MCDDATVLKIDISTVEAFLSRPELEALAQPIAAVAADLEAGRGPGADYLGWLDLPENLAEEDFEALETAAARARQDAQVLVVIGIGGSYLGARAVLEALGSGGSDPEIVFAGTSLCSVALDDVLERVRNRDFRVCVISKSGTTLEPAVAFRVFRSLLVERYGSRGAADRITAITDARRGALCASAAAEGYQTFVIPHDVGGRFSVLTPVGLYPLAVAGVDVRELVAGARQMRQRCGQPDLFENPAHLYAAVRHLLYASGFTTEILSTFHSRLRLFQEWWKQLYGESEGKDGLGIFPASAQFTTDLHSLGQYIQDGRRQLLETFLCVRRGDPDLVIPEAAPTGAHEGKGDGLDYLVGCSLDEINWKAYLGTRAAHVAGGVPCLSFELDSITTRNMGGLIYMFEKAVAVSGRLLGVNPFDQPGVEAYKKEMFNLLGRP